MAKLSKRKLLNLDPSDIGRMKAPELRKILQGARQLFNSQSKTFEKYNEKVYSHSYEKMREYYRDNGREKYEFKGGIEFYSMVPENMSHMTMNQMRGEIFRLQEFFDSKTSTVPGAKKVTSDMAKRIFGETKRGRPQSNLSVDEWREFWSIYDEYKKQRPSDVQEQSNIVQQALGQMVLQSLGLGHMPAFGQSTLDELKDKVNQRRDWEMVENDEGSTVFSGTRPY